ncbi:MAG: DegV family EDD domain-containing protein [Eubacterium sp.]|nr:DegV family EDD domain-containing protein [Eubacterium sp.]
MKDMLEFILRPGFRDPKKRQIRKLGIKSALNIAAVVCPAICLGEIIYLVVALVAPEYYGEYLWEYVATFFSLIVIVVAYEIIILWVKKDYDRRYLIMPMLNVVGAAMLLGWAGVSTWLDSVVFGHVETTVLMIVSMCVPFCIYMEAIFYVIITVISITGAIALYAADGWEKSFVQSNLGDFILYSGVQIILGISLLYMKYRNSKQQIESEEQRNELEALSQAQNRFFSSMSHEIRTPINTIIGLNEMILREDISDEVAQDAANIQSAGKMLLHLINDILDMSKIESGQMEIAAATYNTADMLSDIVGMLWIRAQDKGLKFSVEVEPDLPSQLVGDEMRIRQVLINILNNAIKYTKEGSVKLSIQCEQIDANRTKVIYSVTDTGMGIRKENIPHLFDAFKRIEENKNKYIEGTGLGLSIVKQLVDMMDGTITVNSIYTKGSTFIVELPQEIADDTVVGEISKKSDDIARKDYKVSFTAPDAKVLAVDDNQSNLLVVSKLLRDTQVQMDTVQSGREALEKTLATKYDVIFMDHMMPEMDGIECMHKIREQVGGLSRDAKIIALTANAGRENQILYSNEGFDGYQLKPVNGESLERELYNQLPHELVKAEEREDSEILEDSMAWMQSSGRKKLIAITTESVADIPKEFIKKYGIGVIPHRVITPEGEFDDGDEIESSGLMSYMEKNDSEVYSEIYDVKGHEYFFAEQLEKARNVIHIALSSGVERSGYFHAVEATKAFDNVTVIDSKHLSSGMALLVIEAARLASEGRTVEEIVTKIERMRADVNTNFIVDNMDYLARAKQVSPGIARIAKSFMLHPVIQMKKGDMGVGGLIFGSREHSWKKYMSKCFAKMKNCDRKILFITYVGLNSREIEYLRSEIIKKQHFERIIFQKASPSIAVNCGPGTFGLLFVKEEY